MHFDDETRKARERFEERFRKEPDALIAEYREEFGNYICTDNARELCPEYRDAPPEKRAEIAPAIGLTAINIVNAAFDEALKEDPELDQENIVMFVAGGPGSGKTTFINENWATNDLLRDCHIVCVVVSGLNEENVEKAFAAGKDALIVYIHRPIEHAVTGVLSRAEEDGRCPNFSYTCEAHLESQRQMLKLGKQYEEHPGFLCTVGNNSQMNSKGFALVDEPLEFLKNNAYQDIEEAKERAFEGVQNAIRNREEQKRPFEAKILKHFFGGEEREMEALSKARSDGAGQSSIRSEETNREGEAQRQRYKQ